MELAINSAGKKAGSIQVSEQAFGCKYNEALIHQVVTAYMAAGRAGTKAQKTRSEVSGGGIKPWRQKGTGRARAGTIRSPLWRKGGIIFAAKPRDHSQKVNRKMYQRAMASIVSELLRQERLIIVEDFKVDSHKTRDLMTKLSAYDMKHGLLVLDTEEPKLELASRNIPNILVLPANQLDPVTLIGAEKVIISVAALKQLEERLS